jgi:hypothetical protein
MELLEVKDELVALEVWMEAAEVLVTNVVWVLVVIAIFFHYHTGDSTTAA